MMMKKTPSLRRLAIALTALAGGVLAAACTASPRGQLIVAFKTDMSLPKDVDAVRIIVFGAQNNTLYNQSFGRDGDGELRLPATLAVVAPGESAEAVKVRVIATKQSDVGVRVLREVVTTVPPQRAATLEIPIQFLCDGSGEVERDAAGNVVRDEFGNAKIKNNCPDGLTCVAGSCVEAEVDSATLPDFTPEEVFGGGDGSGNGNCFEAYECFKERTVAALDLDEFAASNKATCRAKASGEINVALATQGSGTCGAKGCYVPLDANSDAGWKKASTEGLINLPSAICEKASKGEIVGLVAAPVGTGTCAKKTAALPNCGPWSSTGTALYQKPNPALPTLIAAGQFNPVSLALSTTDVYWTASSTFDTNDEPLPDGAVKSVPLAEGGEPFIVASDQLAPHDIAVDAGKQFVFWTNTAGGDIRWADFGVEGQGTPLADKLQQPAGIALFQDKLYFTDLTSQEVTEASWSVSGSAPSLGATQPIQGSVQGTSPYRVAAVQDGICWTYQGQLDKQDGAVGCRLGGMSVQVSSGPMTPRAVALEVDAQGNLAAVYWANFVKDGGIFRATRNGSGFSTQEELAPGQNYPNGIALDADGNVYWTNRGDGTVMRWSRADDATAPLAKDQNRPGAIAVSGQGDVVWINEGTGLSTDKTPVKDGAIMKLSKEQLSPATQ